MKVSVTTPTTAERLPEMLAWDTEFWGIGVGRAYPENLGHDTISEWALANTVGLVCLLIDADKPEEAAKAETQGFSFRDVRVTLGRQTRSSGGAARLARIEDLAVMRRIARTSHRITRFYADPRLPDEHCDELYEEWIRRSFAGWADLTLVSEREEEPVGYVTVHVKEDGASIGLIAVDEKSRGRGVGHELVSSAVNWAHGQKAGPMTVVTQGRNIAALRLFEDCGFRITSTQLWYHKWYLPMKPK